MRSLHAGVTSETPAMLDFAKADKTVYADVMRKFSHFVWRARRSCGSIICMNAY
jgi:hypothetical protein